MRKKQSEADTSHDRAHTIARRIVDIEAIDSDDDFVDELDAPFVPEALLDDPISGDGSVGRVGVGIAPWRFRTLRGDRMGDASEPGEDTKLARRAHRAHERSRSARSEAGRRRRRRRRVVLATLLTLLVVAVVAVGATYALELWGGKAVPNVVGMSEGNAVEALEAKGFAVTIQTVPSDAVEGHAIALDPRQGTRVEPGSAVLLTIGQSRHVPKVIGLTEDEARKALADAGANNVHYVSRVSFEPEGTVIETRPEAEAVFISTDEIRVVISQLPRMPDVVGQEERVAYVALEHDEIPYKTAYERGSLEDRLRVVRTEPAVGESVDDKGAIVVVGDPLIDILRVSDYFDAQSFRVCDFAEEKGFALKVSHFTQDGHLVARFNDEHGSYVAFLCDPWSRAVANDRTAPTDAMESDDHVEGVRISIPIVRIEIPAESSPADAAGQQNSETSNEANKNAENGSTASKSSKEPTVTYDSASLLELDKYEVSEETAQGIMRACGFTDVRGACTQETIEVPAGTSKAGHVFYCCFGEIDNRVWTIFIRGAYNNGKAEPTEAVITCAPRATYATIDLSKHGGKVCDYVAYQEEYAR